MNTFDIAFPEYAKRTKTVKLITGTNNACSKLLLKRVFNDLSWWSDNLETAAHYYEGKIIEITVVLDKKKDMGHIRCLEELAELGMTLDQYEYGSAEVLRPKGAIWYSFSKSYLEEHIINIKEIFPDMRDFNEEGAGY